MSSMKTLLLVVFLALFHINLSQILTVESTSSHYDPTWDSLDTRPLPEWYDKAKIGIFLHWGVFSVPSFGSEWFWAEWKGNNASEFEQFMKNNYLPGFTYQDFAKDFKAEFYDPAYWAKIFKDAGANYVVLTSKHHEGYTMWPSAYAFSWNAMDVGPHRDLLGDLAAAVRAEGMRFGLYHSLYEWYHPVYNADKASGFQTQNFVDNKILPEMKELVENYKPEVIWSDGDWEANDTYWKSTDFLAWLYNESPVRDTVVANDRWGSGIPCHHGDVYTCTDRYNPGVLQPHKWENCMTVDKQSWGYRRNANYEDYLTTHELIKTIVETISCRGNILINVGPTKEGTIIPIFQERLKDLGKWLRVNGEAIYESVPWTTQNDTLGETWYTSSRDGSAVYAISLEWPDDSIIRLGSASTLFSSPKTNVHLLGMQRIISLIWTRNGDVININLPNKATINMQWAWTLKITN